MKATSCIARATSASRSSGRAAHRADRRARPRHARLHLRQRPVAVPVMEPSDVGNRMGHEFIGIVEDVGADVRTVKRGDLVVAPFAWSDGTCEFCRQGLQTSCLHGGFWGGTELDGGQGEAVRVPQADGTLVVLPVGPDHALMPSLLTLTDVMGTGHHAALAAKVGPGKIAAVVGDGAVGLCGVIAARRLGAEQIILLGRHADRIALARDSAPPTSSASAATPPSSASAS